MSGTQTTPFAINAFRAAVLAFACVVGSLASWILVTEFLRPADIRFTTDKGSATSMYPQLDAAVLAARVGIVRGDIWSQAAFAYGDMLWSQDKSTSDEPSLERMRALIEHAIAFAPHDSRLWLLAAGNYSRSDKLSDKALAALKMSFYTGANSIAVVPERLMLAMQSPRLDDYELQELVRHDIKIAVNHKSELLPALIAAYKEALPSGRQVIEKAIGELDPTVLTAIRAGVGQH